MTIINIHSGLQRQQRRGCDVSVVWDEEDVGQRSLTRGDRVPRTVRPIRPIRVDPLGRPGSTRSAPTKKNRRIETIGAD